jgi:hypothetical protein
MPLPLARPDANEVVLVVGRDPIDPRWWLYAAERAGDGPGSSEVLDSGGWRDYSDRESFHRQVIEQVPKPVEVAIAGLAWSDAEPTYIGEGGTTLRLSWRLPEEG